VTLFDAVSVANILVEPGPQEARWPVLLYNRGGNQKFGPLTPERVLRRLVPYAKAGYLVVASQYRGGEGSEGEDEFGGADLDDVLQLPELLRSHPNADLDRIGMLGESRGGMMTYLALRRVNWIKAAISVAGFSDLERAARLRPEMGELFRERFGGGAEAVRERSSVHYAADFHKGTPLLLLHGSADWRVSPLDSLDLSRALLEHRAPHRLVLFEGGDHMLSEHRQAVEGMMLDWLEAYLVQGRPWPSLDPHGP
jgi:dipeptidyl aminopeptidase/acylaminoacyl peptidase